MSGDRCHAADCFFREGAELQRQRACELSVEIDRAAAHARDHPLCCTYRPAAGRESRPASVPERFADAEHDEIDLFDLSPSKDRVSHALHAGLDLADGDCLGSAGHRAAGLGGTNRARNAAAKTALHIRPDRGMGNYHTGRHQRKQITAGSFLCFSGTADPTRPELGRPDTRFRHSIRR